MNRAIDQLSRRLGYSFTDPGLLQSALSHRSAMGKSNERLEFLGDAVLNFVIAAALYTLCPKAQEGDLSRLRANLVKGETLARMAQEFELGQYLRLGLGELKSGGAQRQSILADAMEAVIGAIYLDSGFEICRALVLQWYETRLNEVKTQKVQVKDPKTCLQELLQSKRLPLPMYLVSTVSGAMHEQQFTVSCTVAGDSFIATGTGASRRKAEQTAAAEYLKYLQSLPKPTYK